jgi:protein involved in polysaccharide export with SLBB domain
MKYKIILIWLLFSVCLSAQISDAKAQIYFNVSVTGAVADPGVYSVQPSTRVSELIKMANLSELSSEPINEISSEIGLFDKKYESFLIADEATPAPSYRKVELIRKNEKQIIDLMQFFNLGVAESNPFVLDGDIIHVPAMMSSVILSGEVQKPGEIELVEGDRISDILKLAFGLKEQAYLKEAVLIRIDAENKLQEYKIDLSGIYADPAQPDNMILESEDHLIIRSKSQFTRKFFVKVGGEVKFPGDYVIREKQTTLLDILDQVGIDETKADLTNAFLQRPNLLIDFDPEFERLKDLPPQQMSYLEYSYFKNKIREQKAKMSVDFQKLWQNRQTEDNILLQNNDFIFIPLKTENIFVSGQVTNPGLVRFEPGLCYLDYVEKCGGFLNSARKNKIRIIRGESAQWLKPDKNLTLQSGDIIFIPEKPEMDYWQITKETLTMLTQVATLIIVVRNYR